MLNLEHVFFREFELRFIILFEITEMNIKKHIEYGMNVKFFNSNTVREEKSLCYKDCTAQSSKTHNELMGYYAKLFGLGYKKVHANTRRILELLILRVGELQLVHRIFYKLKRDMIELLFIRDCQPKYKKEDDLFINMSLDHKLHKLSIKEDKLIRKEKELYDEITILMENECV